MAFAVMNRRKVVTALNLLGISFTLAFLTMVYALYDLQYGPVYPMKDTNKMVFYNGLPAKLKSERGEYTISICSDYKTYKQLQKELESVEHFAIQRKSEFGFFHEGKYMSLSTTYVDAGYWDIMDFSLIEGRFFLNEDVENRNKIAVISAHTASIFFPEGNAIGNNIKIEKNVFNVIGIVENVGMKSLEFADVWIPVSTINRFSDRFSGKMTFYMHEGVSTKDLNLEISRWVNKNEEEILAQIKYPGYKLIPAIDELKLYSFGDKGYLQTFVSLIPSDNKGGTSSLQDMNNFNNSDLFILNILIFVVIILFLSIPVINMVNLNSSQIADRASEIGIRKSFGATTQHLVRQFLMENIILNLTGGILSIGISLIAMNLLQDHLLNTNPLRDVVGSFQLNWRILAWCFFSAVGFGIISGVLPAYRMSKLNAVNAIKGTIK